MPRRHGMQLEILLSLLFVVVTATGILSGLLVKTYESRTRQIQSLTASALREDGASPLAWASVPGQRWWTLSPDRLAPESDAELPLLDDESRALGTKARERNLPLLREGMPWEPIRFAVPLERTGYVAVTYVPPAVSPAVWIALLVGDVAVFTVFGGYLLRRRVVVPMQRMAQAARGVADGDLGSRLPIEAARESAEVAIAFNEMAAALENRTLDLEKAVRDLRESNRHLRDAREGLDRAERLAAVGRLAAGVAHEIGNPMGALLAFLDLVKRDEGVSESSREYLGRAAREGERVRVILRQVLEFSSPPRGAAVPVDILSLCRETASLLRAQRRYDGIAIEVVCEGGRPVALADANGVSQILLNLFLNAADALRRNDLFADTGEEETGSAGEHGANDGPKVLVTVRPGPLLVRAGDRDGRSSLPRREPDAVECVIQDNGPGVRAEDRERIFDPFFTTKPPGEGTGLGLANAARLAEEMGGVVTLESGAESPGARFVLRLPSAGSEPADEAAVRGWG